MSLNILLRLGAVLEGTSADLTLINIEKGNGSGEGDSSDEQDEQDKSGDDGDDSSDSGDDSSDSGDDSSDSGDDGEEGSESGDSSGSNPSDGNSSGDQKALKNLLQAMENGLDDGMKEQHEALRDAVKEAMASDKNVLDDERPWSPLSTEHDAIFRPAPGDREAKRANAILKSVAKETAFLSARLRNKFLEARTKRVMHGVRRGNGLSERRLADSWAEIKSGIAPTRPDYTNVVREDVSLAVALVLDESGSMDERLKDSSRAMAAILAPLDALGCPTMACGFRDGSGYIPSEWDDRKHFHRTEPVTIDLFKTWGERFRAILPNIACTQAVGCTPMADGIQYGLQELSGRRERHRVMLVLTDGDADATHQPVIRRQIRLAREAGITIVGVGIDYGCESVARTFDKFIKVQNIAELPQALLTTLGEIVFPSRGGRQVSLDGKMEFRAA